MGFGRHVPGHSTLCADELRTELQGNFEFAVRLPDNVRIPDATSMNLKI
jgi:hypothetical protein